MIVFTLQLTSPPQKRKEILDTLRSLVGPTHVEPGCLGCHLQQDVLDPNLLTFVEEWERETDLDRHMSSREYRRLLAVMDMASALPRVTFMTVSDVEGFERIARGSNLPDERNECRPS
jgi:quinol monooxygenase YgiN